MNDKKKIIFLDRDGTLNIDTGYTYKPTDLQLEKNVIEGLNLLQKNDFEFIIVTNQSGIARGYYTEDEYFKFQEQLLNKLKSNDINILASYFCPYHPTKGIGKYKQDSLLRKPATGMLEAAARQFPIDKNSSWIIGDKWIDVRTGINFDIKQILVQTGKNGSDIEHQTTPTFIAKDLINAAELIISYK